jgi:hypothetical protein
MMLCNAKWEVTQLTEIAQLECLSWRRKRLGGEDATAIAVHKLIATFWWAQQAMPRLGCPPTFAPGVATPLQAVSQVVAQIQF